MKRTPLRRTSLIRKSEKRRTWRRAESDKVSEDTANYVAARDRQCVLSIIDSGHTCRSKWGDEISPFGEYEIDHVDVTGFGKRGASVKNNLVRACPWGHAEKTNNARLWRPLLRDYLRKVEGSVWSEQAA